MLHLGQIPLLIHVLALEHHHHYFNLNKYH